MTEPLTEQDIQRFRVGDILFSDEQAKMFCDLALKGLRAEALPSSAFGEGATPMPKPEPGATLIRQAWLAIQGYHASHALPPYCCSYTAFEEFVGRLLKGDLHTPTFAPSATTRIEGQTIEQWAERAKISERNLEEWIKAHSHPMNYGIGDAKDHLVTDKCGFDRSSSISEDRYVCDCGWRG